MLVVGKRRSGVSHMSWGASHLVIFNAAVFWGSRRVVVVKPVIGSTQGHNIVDGGWPAGRVGDYVMLLAFRRSARAARPDAF